MRPVRNLAPALLGVAALVGCGGGGGERVSEKPPSAPATIRLQSPAFADGATLPREVTCDGAGRSPALRWSGVPDRTRELVLFVDDPDAPGGTFSHWTVWHLDASAHRLADGRLPAGARQAQNSSGKRGWTPPCPPEGDKAHRYVFTLLALRRPLDQPDGAPLGDVRDAASSGALARGELTGRYGR